MTTDEPTLARVGVDRAAEHRDDAAWLDEAWVTGRVLTIDGRGQAAVVESEAGPELVLTATDGPRPAAAWFVGVDPDGVPMWTVTSRYAVVDAGREVVMRGLRDVGAELPARDSALLVAAVALSNWHATHVHCPRCGTPTEVVQAGWQRTCPNDGSSHFPRTDPAVIVLIHDGGDRCLLGRQPSWPQGRYSTLAGFVESGESAEAAVRREVREESGIVVSDVVYRSSQPWPFPQSLMLGFEARAVGGTLGDGDDELEDVRWFSRDELRAGAILLPPPASIAHWLITSWLGRPEPASSV